MAQQEFSIIQGDSFFATGTYVDANDNPVDLVAGGVTVESWIRSKDGSKFDLNVTYSTTEIGKYVIEGATDDWPMGRNTWHIRYIVGTIKRSTEPVVVNVEAD